MSESPKPRVPRPRIQSLSDLVFGLALTIGAVQLASGSLPADNNELLADIGRFGFDFLVLISVWNRYTSLMSVLPIETQVLVRLNMVLLFLVALEPYLFNLIVSQPLTSSPLGPQVSAYFALDVGGMNLILSYFAHILTLEEKNLIPARLVRPFKAGRNMVFVAGLVFLASAAPIIWTLQIGGLPIRIFFWAAAIPMIWMTRLALRPESAGKLAADGPDQA